MKRFLWGLLAFFTLTVVCLVVVAHRPDFEIEMSRTVSGPRKASEAALWLENPATWPKWHHMLKNASAPQGLGIGQIVSFDFIPKGLEWKRFTLKAKVIAHRPGVELKFELISDTKEKITRLFDRLVWSIECDPTPEGVKIQAHIEANTHHWRSRLIGLLAPKVLLNQVLYADLDRLAGTPEAFRVAIVPE